MCPLDSRVCGGHGFKELLGVAVQCDVMEIEDALDGGCIENLLEERNESNRRML